MARARRRSGGARCGGKVACAAIGSVAALLVACTTHVPLAADYAGPEPLPEALRVSNGAAATSIVDSSELDERDRARFVVRELALPSVADPRDAIELYYFDVEGEGVTPVVVLLPIFTGHTAIPRYFARYFANRGWAAVVVGRGRDPLASLERPEEAVQRTLSDYRRVLDWVEQQPELDAGRIGLFGVSLGAMDAVMLTALDERVHALVVAMAGGDWPSLMTTTRYRPVMRTVDDLAASRGTSREELSREFDARLDTDPLGLAPYIDAERVLMIITRSDVIVPVEAQERLRESMGEPETLYLVTGHRSSVFLFPKVRAAAFEFLAEHFAADAAPHAKVPDPSSGGRSIVGAE